MAAPTFREILDLDACVRRHAVVRRGGHRSTPCRRRNPSAWSILFAFLERGALGCRHAPQAREQLMMELRLTWSAHDLWSVAIEPSAAIRRPPARLPGRPCGQLAPYL